MSRKVTSEELDEIKIIMDNENIPLHVWFPIMFMESSGRVGAFNPGTEDIPEQSHGLFQLNSKANAWLRDLIPDLSDPIFNAKLAVKWLNDPRAVREREKYEGNPAKQAEVTWRRGIRPHWQTVTRLGRDEKLKNLATVDLYNLFEKFNWTPKETDSEIEAEGYWIGGEWFSVEELKEMGLYGQEFLEGLGERAEAPRWMRGLPGLKHFYHARQFPDEFVEEVEGEEPKPSWANPIGRIWWEISTKLKRGLIILLGSLMIVVALVLLLLPQATKSVKTVAKIKTGGLINMGEKG